MPIMGEGWELHIVRTSVQNRRGGTRTVATYQVFHDGVAQTGPGLSGTAAEASGPGANQPAGNGKRIERGRYPIATREGEKYVTIGFNGSESSFAKLKPGIELLQTGERTEILIHPGKGFIRSAGCINLCTSLPTAAENIDYQRSRKCVIAVIEDLKDFLGADFPATNGVRIPKAFVVIDGEP
ncbi:MAG: hypothetical protein ACREDW_09390 [Aestuariivirgaceae bacterium]